MAFLLTNIFEKLNSRGKISICIRIWQYNWRKIQKSHGKTQNSRKKLNTQGKNSRSGRIFPHLASQVVLKKSLAYRLLTGCPRIKYMCLSTHPKLSIFLIPILFASILLSRFFWLRLFDKQKLENVFKFNRQDQKVSCDH